MALLRVTDTRELSGEIEAIPLRLSIEGEGIFVKGGWKKELATRGGSEIRSALNSDTARRVVVNFRHECATLVLQVSVHT